MKLDRFIKKIINDPLLSLNDRVFVVLTIASVGMTGLAFLGDLIYGENMVEITTLLVAMIVVPLLTFLGMKTGRLTLIAKTISLGVIFIIMPIVYFFGGGVDGAVIPWLIFAYLYIGLVLSGYWRVCMLITHSLIVVFMFILSYYYPELTMTHTREVKFIDTALAVIEVGYICFVMTWFQGAMYHRESDMAKEETKKVEDMNRSQNRFFSNMSHEIRTPINSILGLNELILRDPGATAGIRKDASNIQGAGRMLLALINDILDFSKIEAGQMDIVPINYSVAALVSEIVNMMILPAQEKGLKLNVEVDPTIPSELYGDEIRIKQILINLLNNAVKYTKEGSVTLHIEKEAEEEGQVILLISVSDTGIGIKQDLIPHLFDAFKRVDEDKNAGIEGTGLGLSIVKQLVELMNGRITVDSVYTQGSTFTVMLRQKVSRSDVIGSIEISSFGNVHGAGEYVAGFTARDVRILIVDDNRMNLEVEKKLLEDTGITVDTASSGEEALSMTLTQSYDVILMDHLMPGMDGIECLQNIRKQTGGLNNRVPVIVLTANAGGENRELYIRSGFEDYLVKPVSGRQLEDMLLLYMPSSKVTINEDSIHSAISMNTSRDYNRKLPVIVTCSGTCDLPAHVIRKYNIDTIPFTISSKDRVFYDGIEATTDEIIRYRNEGVVFTSSPPGIEDFRKFYGGELKKAHNLIFITGSSNLSPEYEWATEAARSYDNVVVIDSRSNSTAVGLLVLLANRMASRGEPLDRVLEEIEKARRRIRCSFVMDSTYFLRRGNIFSDGVGNFMKAVGMRIFINCNDGDYGIERAFAGDFDRYHVKFIDHAFAGFSKPDLNLVVVIYTQLSEEQKESIRAHIRKHYEFEHVIFRKGSAVIPVNMGNDTFGLVFFDGFGYSYDLGALLEEEEPGPDPYVYDYADHYDDEQEAEAETETGETEKETEKDTDKEEAHMGVEEKSYLGIRGMDRELGIKSSGTEETFKMLLEVYRDSIIPNHDEICDYYDKEDWKNYTVKVHALKSSSLLVGLAQLSEEARLLEMAGKDGDIDYIRENHSRVMNELKSLKEPMDAALSSGGQNAEDVASSGDDANEGFDRFLIESIYEAIRDGAASKDPDMIKETFEEASEYEFSDKDTETLDLLRKLSEEEKYDEIISVIDGM